MGLRGLTAFALAHAAGTALLLVSIRDLGADALSGDAGAALLLTAGGAAVLAGARIALSVHLAHMWRACRAFGLTAAPVHAAALRMAPRAMRSIVAAAVGGSLSLVALTAPSLAASPSAAWPLTSGPAAEETHDPAWSLSEDAPDEADQGDVDDRDVSDVHAGSGTGQQEESGVAEGSGVHVVSPGESLWQIVAADLPGAATKQLTERVDEVHAANRTTIGDDANLLLPGQRLVMP